MRGDKIKYKLEEGCSAVEKEKKKRKMVGERMAGEMERLKLRKGKEKKGQVSQQPYLTTEQTSRSLTRQKRKTTLN